MRRREPPHPDKLSDDRRPPGLSGRSVQPGWGTACDKGYPGEAGWGSATKASGRSGGGRRPRSMRPPRLRKPGLCALSREHAAPLSSSAHPERGNPSRWVVERSGGSERSVWCVLGLHGLQKPKDIVRPSRSLRRLRVARSGPGIRQGEVTMRCCPWGVRPLGVAPGEVAKRERELSLPPLTSVKGVLEHWEAGAFGVPHVEGAQRWLKAGLLPEVTVRKRTSVDIPFRRCVCRQRTPRASGASPPPRRTGLATAPGGGTKPLQDPGDGLPCLTARSSSALRPLEPHLRAQACR